MATFVLSYPPSINHYYRHSGGRTLISRAGRKYREMVQIELWQQSAQRCFGRLCVTIEVYPPDKRRRDLDNLLKPALDALQDCGVIEDDSHVCDLRIVRREVVKGGQIVVRIVGDA